MSDLQWSESKLCHIISITEKYAEKYFVIAAEVDVCQSKSHFPYQIHLPK